jgi:hypothetical protein
MELESESDGDKKPAAKEKPGKPAGKRKARRSNVNAGKRKKASKASLASGLTNLSPEGPSRNTRSSAARRYSLHHEDKAAVLSEYAADLAIGPLEAGTPSEIRNVEFLVKIQNGEFVFTTADDDTPRPFFQNIYQLAGEKVPVDDDKTEGQSMALEWPSLTEDTLDDHHYTLDDDEYRRAAMWVAIRKSFSRMYQCRDQDWAKFVLKGLNDVMNYEKLLKDKEDSEEGLPNFEIKWEDLRP